MKTRRYRITPVFTHIEDVLAWLSHSPDPLVQRRVQRRHPQRLTHTILTGDSDQQIQMTRRHRDEPCDRRATSESPRSPHCGPPGRSPPSSASSNSASRRCASAAGSYRSSSCDCFAKSRTDHRHRNGVSAASPDSLRRRGSNRSGMRSATGDLGSRQQRILMRVNGFRVEQHEAMLPSRQDLGHRWPDGRSTRVNYRLC